MPRQKTVQVLSLSMAHFNFNGKLYVADTPVIGADSRGLRYGDGLFETFKCVNGELILFDEHLARLWNGLNLLQFAIPKFFTPDKLQREISSLLAKNNHRNARIRLSVVRGDGGLYDYKDSMQYIIQSWPLSENVAALNDNGLQLGIYREAKKPIDAFSNCKHNNFLPYFMAALYARQMKLNDALVINHHGRICDTTIANVFYIKQEQLFTPPLSEGCIAGVMRKTIIQTLLLNNLPVNEEPLTEDLLREADEVFITNSISKMRWVKSIENKSYTRHRTTEIHRVLSETIPALFC